MKITSMLAIVFVVFGATASAAVFTSKQRATDTDATTARAVAKVDTVAPTMMTMQRPL